MKTRLFISALMLLCALLIVVPVSAQTQTPSTYTVQISQVDTSNYPEVNVYVSVVDANGNAVRTLDQNDFTLLESGQSVPIGEVFQAGEAGPVSAVLTIDRSGSMLDPIGSPKIAAAKQSAQAFVDLMRPEDQTGIVVFNTQVTVVQTLTSDKNLLRQAIQSIDAFDNTAMYDGLGESIEMLQGAQGRKAIILLSDGLDNSSRVSHDQIMQILTLSEVSVFAIGLGNPSVGTGDTTGIDEAALKQIAEQSHGQYMYTPSADNLQAMYEQISLRLQNEYRITYTTPNSLRNGLARGIQVQITPDAGAVQGQSSDDAPSYNPGGLIPETAGTLPIPVFIGLLTLLGLALAAPDLIKRYRGEPEEKQSRVKLTKSAAAGGKKIAPNSVPSAPPSKRKP